MKIHALFNRQVREHINNTVFFTPNEQDSDIAIILGAVSVTGEIARTANQDILLQGLYPKGVLIIGGVTINQPLVYRGL